MSTAGSAEATRKFDSGATRSEDSTRDDPEGYMSPLVEDRFCEYMTKHRVQADGQVRASDNWQKGMPLNTYMKGVKRHLQHWWTRHRGWKVRDPLAGVDIEEDICAVLFNAQGYLHELLKNRQMQKPLKKLPEAIGQLPLPFAAPQAVAPIITPPPAVRQSLPRGRAQCPKCDEYGNVGDPHTCPDGETTWLARQ